MIKITVPNQFAAERVYSIDVLMDEILGLEYEVEVRQCRDVEFKLENGSTLVIRDHFFSLIPLKGSYLNRVFIPAQVLYTANRFLNGGDIPIIYGTRQLEITGTQVVCGIDIISSVFFMLSRWEEYVDDTRDSHGRFPATASLAFKHRFLDRPVVNEYAEMLWRMLQFLGCPQQRKESSFSFVLTHDVDALLKWLSWFHVLKTSAADILKRFKPRDAFSRLGEYRRVRKKQVKDPFDTYDWLMDLSQSAGLKSHFYFMSGGLSRVCEDNHTPYPVKHPFAQALYKKILSRGHVIGFHAGYDSVDNELLWKVQRSHLEEACGIEIKEGRQHYLRFRVPYTWQMWDSQGMQIDSTCGYSDREGFRCGTGHTYSVFNILTRKKLFLKEQPLIFMDMRNFFCGGFKADSLFDHNLFQVIENAKKYGTPVTLLFHNDTFLDPGFKQLYTTLFQM